MMEAPDPYRVSSPPMHDQDAMTRWVAQHGPVSPAQATEWAIEMLQSGVSSHVREAAALLQNLIATQDVDESLWDLVKRALAPDPAGRPLSPVEFRDALTLWLQTSHVDTALSASGASALNHLLGRMRHCSDFPAMSDSIMRIQSMAGSDKESVGSVANEILKDVALTNKLLRLVNSAHFGRGGNINTVSRAVALVGFNGIRNMALSLVLLEHMQDRAHAAQLREEFLRSLMAGSIAGALCANSREGEEAFIGSMFQNLGRLLMQFYFPQEAAQVRDLMQGHTSVALTENSASVRILGLSVEDLGLGVAKAWGLPLSIQRCMRRPLGARPTAARPGSVQQAQWIAAAANDLADEFSRGPDEDLDQSLKQTARHYAPALGMNERDLLAATRIARQKLLELAEAMELQVNSSSPASRLLNSSDAETDMPAQSERDTESAFQSLELHAMTGPPRDTRIADTLTAGIQDVTNAMVEDVKLSDVLRMILETMYRALDFDRIIFCMRDARTETMVGRFGIGQGVETWVQLFKTPLKSATPDLFAVVCIKGTDTMITDASEPRIVRRLPGWYLGSLNAPTFLLLPLQIKGAPFGLIYADKALSGQLELDDKELSLLRTLRNQAVMAFKQSS